MGLYDNMRPTDLRHEYPHALAEMVQDLERTADKVAAGQTEAKQLLAGALATSKGGVERFDKAAERLREAINGALSQLGQATGGLIVQMGETIKEPAEHLTAKADEVANQADLLVDHVREQTNALVEASKQAEADRKESNDARMKLVDYRGELEAYVKEVTAHEQACKSRIAEAQAKAYDGLGFWERVWAVFSPPKVKVELPKAPTRPTLAKAKAKGQGQTA